MCRQSCAVVVRRRACDGSTLCGADGRSGQGDAGSMGGAHRAPRGGTAVSRRVAVRVLRAGFHRRSSGPGDRAGVAVGAGRTGGRAWADRGGVLRHRAEPRAGVGTPPAGRRPGRRAGRPGPWLGRDCDRRIRAGLLRRPVRVGGAAVRALRRPAVDSRGRWADRLWRRGPRTGDAGAGIPVQAGDHPHKDPGPYRDGGPDPRAGRRRLNRGSSSGSPLRTGWR